MKKADPGTLLKVLHACSHDLQSSLTSLQAEIYVASHRLQKAEQQVTASKQQTDRPSCHVGVIDAHAGEREEGIQKHIAESRARLRRAHSSLFERSAELRDMMDLLYDSCSNTVPERGSTTWSNRADSLTGTDLAEQLLQLPVIVRFFTNNNHHVAPQLDTIRFADSTVVTAKLLPWLARWLTAHASPAIPVTFSVGAGGIESGRAAFAVKYAPRDSSTGQPAVFCQAALPEVMTLLCECNGWKWHHATVAPESSQRLTVYLPVLEN